MTYFRHSITNSKKELYACLNIVKECKVLYKTTLLKCVNNKVWNLFL